MIPIEIWISSRLYAPLALAIGVLAWSVLRDKPATSERIGSATPLLSRPR